MRPLASRRVPTATVPTKDSGREGTPGAEARRVAGVAVRWCYEGVIVGPGAVAGQSRKLRARGHLYEGPHEISTANGDQDNGKRPGHGG